MKTAETIQKTYEYEQSELKLDHEILTQLLEVKSVASADSKATIVSTSKQIMEKWFTRYADKPGPRNWDIFRLSCACYQHCSIGVSVPVDMS